MEKPSAVAYCRLARDDGAKKVAAYCRVDGGGSEEAQQAALEGQRDQLGWYAPSHDLRIVGWYQDAGLPGHDLARPGLNQMVEDFNAGKFDAVLVVNRSRLFRGAAYHEPSWPFSVISLDQLEKQTPQ